ncbi:MAG: hypothetical protein ABI120_09425, partial [Gemmatimonadaceae bacterium]
MFTPGNSAAVKKSSHKTPVGIGSRARVASLVLAGALFALVPLQAARAQGGGGGQGSPATPLAASISIKKAADRDDPINFLLERKKMLVVDKTLEDSLKNYRDEMRHMQDVVFKDLDKAAAKKTGGQLPSA